LVAAAVAFLRIAAAVSPEFPSWKVA
jgi:hypothetical protein